MDTILIKCFICDTHCIAKDIYIGNNLARTLTMPISVLLEKCLHQSIAKPDKELYCKDCTKKIKEYDQLMQLSQQIEYELFKLFQRKSIESYILVEKVNDMDDDVDGELVLIHETKTIPEIKQQKHDGLDDSVEQTFVWSMEDEEKIEHDVDDSKYGMVIEYLEPDDLEEIKSSQTRTSIATSEINKKSRRPLKMRQSNSKNTRSSNNLKSIDKSREKVKKPKSPNTNFTCKKCNCSFESMHDLKEHRKTHAVKLPVFCELCGQSYKSKAALAIHIGLHKGESPHECEICGKKFTQRGALLRHMPMHTDEKPYQCDKCGKRFVHYSSFHMHEMVHTNERSKKCNICGLELRSNSHLIRHLRVHSGEKPYECPECGQKFAQRYNMRTHYNMHKGIHQKNHKYAVCDESFIRREKLNAHLRNQHNMVQTDGPREEAEQHMDNLMISKKFRDDDDVDAVHTTIYMIKEEANIFSEHQGSFEAIVDVKQTCYNKRFLKKKNDRQSNQRQPKRGLNLKLCDGVTPSPYMYESDQHQEKGA